MRKKKWPGFFDIFSLHPPSDEQGRTSFESINDENVDLGPDDGTAEENVDLFENPQRRAIKDTWHKIRFDNTIRLMISVPTYAASVLMWVSGAIASIMPMTIVFTAFGAVQFFVTWFFRNNRFARNLDFVMSTCDIVCMSVAIYCTGGTDSPLYFIYFIPLIVHAFHRDWALVFFNGMGGSVLYASAILNSMTEFSSVNLTNLGTRLFFMFLTLGIVYFAVRLLRKKDAIDFLRLNRLRALTLIGRRLNKVSSFSELPSVVATLIKLVNEGLGSHLAPWSRFLLVGDDPGILRAASESGEVKPELKQEIPAGLCPAMKSSQPFYFEERGRSVDCPIESFSFGSHICLPIAGTENETFGVLFAGSRATKAFNNEEHQFLQYVTRSLALSIQRLQRMEELKKAVEMNSCVMATYISSSRSVTDTYRAILEGTATILKADQVTLMTWDAKDLLLRTVDVYGSHSDQSKEFVTQMGEGTAGRTLESKQPFWTTDSQDASVKALVCFPLLTLKGEPLGVITAVRTEKREAFSQADIDTASTFSTRAALAIENAYLHKKEKDQLDIALKLNAGQKAA